MNDTTPLTHVWDFYPGMIVRMKSNGKLLKVTSPKQKWIHGEFEDGTGWRFQPQHAERAPADAVFESQHGEEATVYLGTLVRAKPGTPLHAQVGTRSLVVIGLSRDGVKLAKVNQTENRYWREIQRNQIERVE